jgi:cytochrome c biogenesis protein CcmG, thiol:disulfide interchange protein DsbE
MVKVLKFAVVAAAAILLGYLIFPGSVASFGNLNNASDRKTLALDLPVLQGGQWSLSEQRGKVVLVKFWATWCPPCRMETPGIVSIAKRYAGQGVEVVGISMDDAPLRAVPPFVSQFGIPYPILLPAASSPFSTSIENLPTSLLIDRKGRVARTYYGMVDERMLAHDIEQLLSERS